MARPATPRDPYEVLGVPRAADDAQIKKAFRTLARELHPDVNTADPQAEEKFKQAAEAYEILSDPERRATYDRFGHEGLRSLALVAAGYGLPQRRLGTVSVIGPLRMDYGSAIYAVRDAAAQLSTFIGEVYDER
jgi:curved DNA-binding protein CbpA